MWLIVVLGRLKKKCDTPWPRPPSLPGRFLMHLFGWIDRLEDGVIGLVTGDPYSGLSAFNGCSHDLFAGIHTHAHKHATYCTHHRAHAF